MNYFTQQIETQIQTTGRLNRSFIRELMMQVWDSTRDDIDMGLTTQLCEALSPNLDLMDSDARELAVNLIRAHQQDTQTSGSPHVHVLAPDLYEQCGACSGSGQTTCSSCGGMGGRSETRIEYDYENNPMYREEWISCFCSGGYVSCGVCGGAGSISR